MNASKSRNESSLSGANTRCFLWFHKWGKWSERQTRNMLLFRGGEETGECSEEYQYRTCARCGMIAEKVIV